MISSPLEENKSKCYFLLRALFFFPVTNHLHFHPFKDIMEIINGNFGETNASPKNKIRK